MSDYQRFVSYIYEYNRGKKSRNTGFAKVESRDGICKIQIHLQQVPEEAGNLQIYAFVREGDWLKGILLGNAPAKMPSTEIRIMTPSEHVGNVDYTLPNLAGLWIDSEHGGTYLSVWDDEPVDVKKLVTVIPGEKQQKEEEISETTDASKEISKEAVKEKTSESVKPEEILSLADTAETEPVSGNQEETVDAASPAEIGNVPAEPGETSAAEMREISGEPQEPVSGAAVEMEAVSEEAKESAGGTADTQNPSVIAAEKKDSAQASAEQPVHVQEAAACPLPRSIRPNCRACAPDLEQRWKCLAGRYSHLQPFEGDEVVDCIRISPRDLGVLRQNQWQMGRNSFLMHGYYNYRHLLFGKCRDGRYILGVPGICDNRERYMASMFGFPEFRKSREQKGSSVFGYWCRPIE